jgi:hypothetical protein
MKTFSIKLSLQESFKGFSKWWIPLCGISLIIMISQSWLPKLLLKCSKDAQLLKPYFQAFNLFEKEVAHLATAGDAFINLRSRLIEITQTLGSNHYFQILVGELAIGFTVIFLLLCLLYIITIVISKISVSKTGTEGMLKNSLKKSHYLTLSYLFLSIIKILPFCLSIMVPFTFFILKLYLSKESQSGVIIMSEWLAILFLSLFIFILSCYLYIRFYFTGFIITEASANPFKAIKSSWSITSNQFFRMFMVFLLTLVIDFIALITIIGFIPGNSIKYTFRASVYRQLTES